MDTLKRIIAGNNECPTNLGKKDLKLREEQQDEIRIDISN
jgi:hypothetical protein